MNSRQATAPVLPEGWTDLDVQAIDTVRLLAADAVQKVGNGHPGTAMSLAPAAYLLYPEGDAARSVRAHWPGRDRFVLSCGHSCLTQYIQLYLGGFGLELDDLKSLRTWGSMTPGHPEYGHTDGVEITTGPLGQGVANAVGMAMAARRERGLLDPDAAPGDVAVRPPDLRALPPTATSRKGVTSEASSLAGTQRLGNLTLIYDRNRISIEDDTNIALSEDTAARYAGVRLARAGASTGPTATPSTSRTSPQLDAAIAAAERGDRPAQLHRAAAPSSAGRPPKAEHRQGRTAPPWATRRSPPPRRCSASTRSRPSRSPTRSSATPAGWSTAAPRRPAPSGSRPTTPGPRPTPRARRSTTGWSNDELPAGWEDALPVLGRRPQGRGHPRRLRQGAGRAGRQAAGAVGRLGRPGRVQQHHHGGRARASCPTDRQSKKFPGNPYGRTLHFGIREHAMGSIMNGIAVHGGTRPYGGTFLLFSDYMRRRGPAVGADAAAGHLRLDPRLHRPRRGRPDPPADRAPRRAAGHPRPGRGPTGRRATRPPRPGRPSCSNTDRPAGLS